MSRAYRIKVRESLAKLLRAEDRVSTQLEVLEILPAEQMAQLLAVELAKRGFVNEANEWVRAEENSVQIRIDVVSGTVTAEIVGCETVQLEEEREHKLYEDVGPDEATATAQLRADIRQDLEKKAVAHQAHLQTELTDQLEGTLRNLRQELDQVVNRVTGQALKQKAAQMGQIKELTEDLETGSLTIVVEV